MRISDWSSDVCSSDLNARCVHGSPLRPIIAAVRKDGNRDCRPAPDAGHRAAGGTLNAGPRQCPPDRMERLIPRPLRGQRAAAERAPMNWLNEVLNNDPDPAESQEWIE